MKVNVKENIKQRIDMWDIRGGLKKDLHGCRT